MVLTLVLEAILAVKDEWDRIDGLITLAPYLRGSLVAPVLEAALALDRSERQVELLVKLIPQLKGKQLAMVLAQALEPPGEGKEELSVKLLAALGPQLTGQRRKKVLTQALETALTIPLSVLSTHGQHEITEAMRALAPHLEGDLFVQALSAIMAIDNRSIRVEILLELMPLLHKELREVVLTQALEASLTIPERVLSLGNYEPNRAWALCELAPHLKGNLLRQALEAALALEDPFDRAIVLAALSLDRSPWIQTHAKALRPVLTSILRSLFTQERTVSIKHTVKMLPVWSPLAAPEAIWEIAQTIVNVCCELHWQ